MTLPSQSAGQWVPLKATPAMIKNAHDCPSRDGIQMYEDVWRHMLAAAPEAPDLLAENSKLKGQLEEAVGALKDAVSAIDYVSTFVPADEPITEHNENCIAAVARFNALLSKLKEAGS